MTTDPDRPVALVTGASEGFGRELARLIAADGYDLVLVARNELRLTELAKEITTNLDVEVRVRPADLSSANEQLALAEEVREVPRLQVLVNNAAFSLVDDFAALPVDGIQQMISLNVGALTTLSHAALNNADFCRGGLLLNVGSISSSWPLPFDAVYCSTKAAIEHFTRSLAYEVSRNPDIDVHIQLAKLGGILTDWADRAMGPLKPGEAPSRLIELVSNRPEPAARAIWRQARQRKKVVVFDIWFARLQALFFSAFPRLGSSMVHTNILMERARRSRE